MRFGRLVALMLLPGLLLVDLGNGLVGERAGLGGLPFSPGEAVRGLVVAGGLFLLATVRTVPLPAMRRWTLALGLLLGLGSLYGMTQGLEARDLVYDVSRIVKLLYGPVVAAVLVWAVARQGGTPRDLIGALAWFGALAGLGVVGFKMAGVGELTYGNFSTAHKGLFIAQNDLSLAMGLGLVAAVHQAMVSPQKARHWAFAGLTIAGMLTIGTRMGTVGAAVLPVAVMMLHAGRLRSWSRAMVAGPAGVTGLMLLALVAAYRVEEIRAEPYLARKYELLGAGELTRLVRLEAAFAYLKHRNAAAQAIGEGATRYEEGVMPLFSGPTTRSQAEIDWIDVFGGHGVIGVLAVYGFYLATMSQYRRSRPHLRKPLADVAVLGIGVYLAHATLAGHALGSPLPSGAVAPWLALLWLGPFLSTDSEGDGAARSTDSGVLRARARAEKRDGAGQSFVTSGV